MELNTRGLAPDEVLRSRTEFGANTLTKRKRRGFWKSFLGNFGDPMIKVLLVALGIQVVMLLGNTRVIETVGIAAAILIAVVVSTLSELGSENAFEKLAGLAAMIECRVRRGGKTILINIAEVVVGDIVLLGAGDKIPADGVIISGSVEVDQSLLNGESKEAKKIVTDFKGKSDFLSPLLLFSGTVVTNGEAVMRVTSVGDKTEYGKIAAELQEQTPTSPLKIKLEKLAKMISLIGYIGAGLVFASYMLSVVVLQGGAMSFAHFINAATLMVAVIVMCVPEGLPMMITVVLSSNMKHMLRDNVLIRKLGGIETAGSMNILFTDKTGTLTHGKLEVVGVVTPDGVLREEVKGETAEQLGFSLRLNTSAEMSKGRAVGGNSTDRILLEYAQDLPFLERGAQKIGSVPFDSKNKFMSTTLADGRVLLKGAPEIILRDCRLDESSSIYKTLTELQNKAMRLVAVAVDKTLIGIIAIRDKCRAESIESVKRLKSAGIQVVMITGDAAATAKAAAQEVGILSHTPSPDGRHPFLAQAQASLILKGNLDEIVLTSAEMARMSDGELEKILPRLRVVARALPADKSRLVRVAQKMNLVCGMTGDGVNDAPALRRADIGFAMGSGTEVAKEAGDIVIMDDNINSISKAVSYGRTIFKSIRKFLIFKLTINMCAMSICIIAPLLKIDTPITVIQMLWINIVMDTLAGLAFGGEKPRANYMKEPPKRRDEQIINKFMWQQIIVGGVVTSVLSIWFLLSPTVQSHFDAKGPLYAASGFFLFFMFMNIFNSFNARTHEMNPFSYLSLNKPFALIMGVVSLVQISMVFFGGAVFRTVPLQLFDFCLVIFLACLVIPIDMLRKLFSKKGGQVGGT